MEDNYLQEKLKSIEENNERHFGDPFFDLHYLMQDFYRNYFSEESMSDYTVEIGILVKHLDSLMASLDDISYGYTEAEADYHKWRVNSFERVLYKALSKEANVIAKMIIQMIHEYEQLSEQVVVTQKQICEDVIPEGDPKIAHDFINVLFEKTTVVLISDNPCKNKTTLVDLTIF